MLTHHWRTGDKPARIVVIGANGFVGGAVVRHAKEQGLNVLPVARADVDLLSANAASDLASILRSDDVVIAASAIAPVKNPQMLNENVCLIAGLVGALEQQPIAHLINISSDAVYADSAEPLNENSRREPSSLHGVMHFVRELLLSEAAGEVPFATVRPTLIYGENDPHNGYGPNRFRRLAESGQSITLFGEGEEQRDHVWIEDVADLIVRIIVHRSFGSLNIATGKVISFRDVAHAVANLFDSPVPIVGSPRVGTMPHNGYRPFDPSATYNAFPDFAYTPPESGFALVHTQCFKEK